MTIIIILILVLTIVVETLVIYDISKDNIEFMNDYNSLIYKYQALVKKLKNMEVNDDKK